MKKILSIILAISMTSACFCTFDCSAMSREKSGEVYVDTVKKKKMRCGIVCKIFATAAGVTAGGIVLSKFSPNGELGKYLGAKAAKMSKILNETKEEMENDPDFKEIQESKAAKKIQEISKSISGFIKDKITSGFKSNIDGFKQAYNDEVGYSDLKEEN